METNHVEMQSLGVHRVAAERARHCSTTWLGSQLIQSRLGWTTLTATGMMPAFLASKSSPALGLHSVILCTQLTIVSAQAL